MTRWESGVRYLWYFGAALFRWTFFQRKEGKKEGGPARRIDETIKEGKGDISREEGAQASPEKCEAT